MKITFAFPVPSLSGGCRVVAIYAQALAHMGHEVTIVCPLYKYGGIVNSVKRLVKGAISPRARLASSHFADLDGIRIIQLPIEKLTYPHLYPAADVLVATWWKTVEWINGFPEDRGKKCYFVQHYEMHEEQPSARVRETYRTRYPKIVIAEWLSRVMNEKYHDDGAVLVPNAVDPGEFYRPLGSEAEKYTLCSMYSESRFKGLDITMTAFLEARKTFPKAKLILFGGKPLRDGYTLPEGVEFELSPSKERLRQIYSSSRAYIFSSRSEGFGLPILEALACGCPVVATRAGCAPEYIKNGINGYLNDIDDVTGQENAINRIFQKDEMAWLHMSNEAQRAVADLNWQNSAIKFERALRSIATLNESGDVASFS
ncbi:glycosyltransferase family 4 protein [Microbulbifer salipaludis]|uniref:Glycosyltransferase family 4 protein n=1 Tax=Microbulbifer salipaludis TaxID=187980 RepID=A0ABS3E2C9_9GAMM|nr:glycosyltransferase family 4 protein [Microbulbifer salipaludis]MBN8429458.1 glycosyltransferase family 4 protein [Microbulbifer salipaludis]